jgi:S1-C subfamily serine protease
MLLIQSRHVAALLPRALLARLRWLALAGLGLWALVLPGPAAASDASALTPIEQQARALAQAHAAVVGVQAQVVEGARSANTLGRLREGSGVIIDDDLVLTIGYLILEAERVQIELDDGRTVPARVRAYDVASGFGLVQALAPLKLPAARLGSAVQANTQEPLMVASGGTAGSVIVAQLVSRRPFSGYWEYHLDSALFTAPAHENHSGAALFNLRGELLGIGSLRVNDARGAGRPGVVGNMFVPVDILGPILGELRQHGASRASTRAWIGINCVENGGQVRVARVSDDSPADIGGVQAGDHIVSLDGAEVRSLEGLWKSLWSGGPAEREVQLEVQRDGQTRALRLQSVDRMKTLRRAEGI